MDARDRHNGQKDKRTNERTDEETSVLPPVRVLDGVWHSYYVLSINHSVG